MKLPEELQWLGGVCKCGRECQFVMVGVSARIEIVIYWECECGLTMTARWGIREISTLAYKLRKSFKPNKPSVKDIQNARTFTKKDREYMKEMRIKI